MNHHMLVRLLASSMFALTLCFSTAALAQDAASLYSQRCVSCHGAQGHGDGVSAQYLQPHPADFTKSLKGKSDDWIAKAIKGGGAAIGESPTMPPYADLSDAQVKDLVAYIKQFSR